MYDYSRNFVNCKHIFLTLLSHTTNNTDPTNTPSIKQIWSESNLFSVVS